MGNDLSVRAKTIKLIEANIEMSIYLCTIIFIINYYLHNCLFILIHVTFCFLNKDTLKVNLLSC